MDGENRQISDLVRDFEEEITRNNRGKGNWRVTTVNFLIQTGKLRKKSRRITGDKGDQRATIVKCLIQTGKLRKKPGGVTEEAGRSRSSNVSSKSGKLTKKTTNNKRGQRILENQNCQMPALDQEIDGETKKMFSLAQSSFRNTFMTPGFLQSAPLSSPKEDSALLLGTIQFPSPG